MGAQVPGGVVQRGVGKPVVARDEAPLGEAGHGGVREGGDEEVPHVTRLEVALLGVDVELRDLDGQAELCEAVEAGEDALGRDGIAADVALKADPLDRRARRLSPARLR